MISKMYILSPTNINSNLKLQTLLPLLKVIIIMRTTHTRNSKRYLAIYSYVGTPYNGI